MKILPPFAMLAAALSISMHAPAAAQDVKTPGSVQATPIEIPGAGKPQVRTPGSVQATPIEIPGQGRPQLQEPGSVSVLPVPLPGQATPRAKPLESFEGIQPVPGAQ